MRLDHKGINVINVQADRDIGGGGLGGRRSLVFVLDGCPGFIFYCCDKTT